MPKHNWAAAALALMVLPVSGQQTNTVQPAANPTSASTAQDASPPDTLMHIGQHDITKPVVLFGVGPQFSEEAKRARFSGHVLVYLWVDKNGNPTHIRVVKGIGMGLDEKAVEAVRQYKFQPATYKGKPVTVDLYVDVNFQILDRPNP